LRNLHAYLDAACDEYHVEELQKSPIEQPGRFLKLLRELGTSSLRLQALLRLEDYITLIQEKDSVLGGVDRIVTGESGFNQSQKYEKACHHLRNALKGVADPVRVDQLQALRVYRIHEYLVPIKTLCVVLIALLSLFEMPSWCYGNLEACSQPPFGAPPGARLYNSEITVAEVYTGLTVELVAVVVLFLTSFLPQMLAFRTLYWSPLINCVAMVIAVVDIIYTFGAASFGYFRTFRMSVWMRPVFFIMTFRAGRSAIKDVGVAVYLSIPLFIILLAYLLLFDVVATLLWSAFPRYSNFWITLPFLQTALTTANYPDVMLPEYYENRWTFVFYFVFLVMGNFFLLSLLLGQIRYSYTFAVDSGVKAFQVNQMRNEFAILFLFLLIIGAASETADFGVPFADGLETALAAQRSDYVVVWEDEAPLSAGRGGRCKTFYFFSSVLILLLQVRPSAQRLRLELLLEAVPEAGEVTEEVFSKGMLPALTAQLDTSHPFARQLFRHWIYRLGVFVVVLCNLAMAGLGTWAVLYDSPPTIDGVFWACQVVVILLLMEAAVKVSFDCSFFVSFLHF
jgi:hypothetical protein